MLVISLPNSIGIGDELAKRLGARCVHIQSKVFPDGEIYIRIPESIPEGEEVLLIQTMYPDQNKRLMELFLTLDALREFRPSRIGALIPYLAYTRQDKVFLIGEPISIRAVLKCLSSLGLNYIVTIDVHNPAIAKYFDGSFHNILPIELFSRKIRELVDLNNLIVIAPDKGAEERARVFSKTLGVTYVVIQKFRDRVTGKITHKLPEALPIEGKDVVIIDDIISTGGTIASIARYVRSRGANKVYVVVSHGLFVGKALEKIRNAGVNKVFVVRTVPPITSDLIEYLDPIDLLYEVISGKAR